VPFGEPRVFADAGERIGERYRAERPGMHLMAIVINFRPLRENVIDISTRASGGENAAHDSPINASIECIRLRYARKGALKKLHDR